MRMMTRASGAVVAITALALTLGCTKDDSDEGGAPQTGKVTYLTGAGVLGREAYIYVAIDKGYFKQAGLDVQVQAGKGTDANLALLRDGKADFAALDITAALIEYGKGTFRDFTIINAIQQRTVHSIMALEGSDITTPRDLAGKKVAYLPGSVAKQLFPAYAKLAGVDESKVQWVNVPLEQHPQNLAAGTVQAATTVAVGKPGIERSANGRKAVVLPYTDYLTDLYGAGVGVAEKSATGSPDKVRRFNEALLKGLRDAIENPEEAGKIYAKYQKVQPQPVAAAENALMVPYVKAAGGDAAVGSLDAQRVARNIAILQGSGVIPAVFGPQEVVSTAFLPRS